MKKQFLFLSVFILAFIAGTSAFAQELVPRDFTCDVSEGPLNPSLGKTYTYSVTVPNSAEFIGTNGLQFRWFVTQEDNIVTDGDFTTNIIDPTAVDPDITIASGTYNLLDASNSIQIIWNASATAADPFFLVITAAGENQICTPNNTKVYKISPVNMFTLDVANVETITGSAVLGTYETDYEDCISDIQTISWPGSTDVEHATYDYGADTLYFAVVGANFSTSYDATVNITNSVDQNLITSVAWSPTLTGTYTDMTASDADTWTATIPVQDADGTVDYSDNGETNFIRVILDYTTATMFWEGLADQTVHFEIDGVTAAGDPDVHYTTWTPVDAVAYTGDCASPDGFENDIANQIIHQRPAVDSATDDGSGGFEIFLTPEP